MDIQTPVEKWPLAAPFRITGRTVTELDVVVVTVRAGDLAGSVTYITERLLRGLHRATSPPPYWHPDPSTGNSCSKPRHARL